MTKESAELVRHEVAFQGYFKVVRYFFRHTLYEGGMSGEISREVFERGQAGGVLMYDPQRDEVVLIRQFRAGAYVAGHHPWVWEVVAGIITGGASWREFGHFLAFTTIGNAIGGAIFVALLKFGHARPEHGRAH